MPDYRLVMTLEGVKNESAQVRAFIDEPASTLASEHEVPLVRDEVESWSGLFTAEGDMFSYRVGICAPPGSCWSLSVRAATDDSCEVLFDSDVLTMAKEWLVGTCEADGGDATRVR